MEHMEHMETSNWGWGGGCGCRPKCRPQCPQSVYAPAPPFGYNVQHPVMVPNEPSHRVDFHPEYWQWPQAGSGLPMQGAPMPGMPGMGMGGY